jgi:GNAT superfamily N-acetyltransferase
MLLDHLAFDDAIVLVAESGEEVAGLASMFVRPRLGWTSPEAWVAEVVVAVEHRRQGVGRMLLDACVREARLRGCRRLVLEAAEFRTDAHAFYEAYGLERTARRYVLILDPVT